jgi:hypothetical protein
MELIIMGRRLDYNKASRNDQARYGLSVKDEAEWMQNDAAARWLRKHSRVVSTVGTLFSSAVTLSGIFLEE